MTYKEIISLLVEYDKKQAIIDPTDHRFRYYVRFSDQTYDGHGDQTYESAYAFQVGDWICVVTRDGPAAFHVHGVFSWGVYLPQTKEDKTGDFV